jgi:hypothetical protein
VDIQGAAVILLTIAVLNLIRLEIYSRFAYINNNKQNNKNSTKSSIRMLDYIDWWVTKTLSSKSGSLPTYLYLSITT